MESDRCETCGFLPCRCADLADPREMLVGHSSAGWPRKSLALGCLRHEIPKKVEQYARRGETVAFDQRTGDMIVSDPGQQKRLCKINGYADLTSREITAPKKKTMSERSIRPRPDRKFSETR